MQQNFTIEKGKPYPIGVSVNELSINVAMKALGGEFGIIIYDENKKKLFRISLSDASRLGNICYARIIISEDLKGTRLFYQLFHENEIILDTKIKSMDGHQNFGKQVKPEQIFGIIDTESYSWDNEKNPEIPYEDSIMYCIHVRGFTKHASSLVQNKGTFDGIIEKIPYLKELGITTIELMPAYEFLENEPLDKESQNINPINYWGYKKGFYYQPKNSYASTGNANLEFKDLIKEFHKNKMEVIMQFYFPDTFPQGEILEILRYWVLEYHVDGFHLKGNKIPMEIIIQDEGLTKTKLMNFDFQLLQQYGEEKAQPYRNLAVYQDDYMYAIRRFLKGDEDMLNSVLYHMRSNPIDKGKINYVSNYYGFTLADMVTYEKKHNEANGENNIDGSDYNHTWNCGIEGKSRRKPINELRKKQIRNALCILFASQGTPLIYMGDEFLNSQKGNNNPYCQDNEITWLNWKNLSIEEENFEFVKMLISLRKEHPILHKERELRIMDYLSCGYPDLSYHGTQAWRPELANYCRHVGMMYCGKYAMVNRTQEDDFFYVAMNMHWEKHEFALPKLPKERKWFLLIDTALHEIGKVENKQSVEVKPRTIQIYVGKLQEETVDYNKKKKVKKEENDHASMETF